MESAKWGGVALVCYLVYLVVGFGWNLDALIGMPSNLSAPAIIGTGADNLVINAGKADFVFADGRKVLGRVITPSSDDRLRLQSPRFAVVVPATSAERAVVEFVAIGTSRAYECRKCELLGLGSRFWQAALPLGT